MPVVYPLITPVPELVPVIVTVFPKINLALVHKKAPVVLVTETPLKDPDALVCTTNVLAPLPPPLEYTALVLPILLFINL